MAVFPIFLGLCVIVSLLLIPGLILAYMAVRKQQPNDRACRACGYPKRGVNLQACPECGAAWNERATADERRGLETAVGVTLLFVFLIALPVLVFGFFFIMLGALG